MTFNKEWPRLKSGLEWGLFYGIVTWLAFTAITNKIPALAIWGMILSRTLMGALAAGVVWEKPLWMRGVIWGVVGYVPFQLLALLPLGTLWNRFFFGWQTGTLLILITGLIIGILIELSMRHRDRQEAATPTE